MLNATRKTVFSSALFVIDTELKHQSFYKWM